MSVEINFVPAFPIEILPDGLPPLIEFAPSRGEIIVYDRAGDHTQSGGEPSRVIAEPRIPLENVAALAAAIAFLDTDLNFRPKIYAAAGLGDAREALARLLKRLPEFITERTTHGGGVHRERDFRVAIRLPAADDAEALIASRQAHRAEKAALQAAAAERQRTEDKASLVVLEEELHRVRMLTGLDLDMETQLELDSEKTNLREYGSVEVRADLRRQTISLDTLERRLLARICMYTQRIGGSLRDVAADPVVVIQSIWDEMPVAERMSFGSQNRVAAPIAFVKVFGMLASTPYLRKGGKVSINLLGAATAENAPAVAGFNYDKRLLNEHKVDQTKADGQRITKLRVEINALRKKLGIPGHSLYTAGLHEQMGFSVTDAALIQGVLRGEQATIDDAQGIVLINAAMHIGYTEALQALADEVFSGQTAEAAIAAARQEMHRRARQGLGNAGYLGARRSYVQSGSSKNRGQK